jgi:hypothetical protein
MHWSYEDVLALDPAVYELLLTMMHEEQEQIEKARKERAG